MVEGVMHEMQERETMMEEEEGADGLLLVGAHARQHDHALLAALRRGGGGGGGVSWLEEEPPGNFGPNFRPAVGFPAWDMGWNDAGIFLSFLNCSKKIRIP